MSGHDAKQLRPGDTVLTPEGVKVKVRKVENDQKYPKTVLINGFPSTRFSKAEARR